MSSGGQLVSSRCSSPCEVTCPEPCVNAWNTQPCVASCGDSRAVVYPPPVVVTFPGPILSSCPQESIVGTTFPTPIGGFPVGYGNAVGLRGSILFGGSNGYGGICNYSRSYNSGYSLLGRGNCSPYSSRRYSTYSRGSCGSC
uniref:Keratin n=1 Tax=Calidris pygmaea TaxID=425635 RepID=A0A8C3JDE7_9CHAR